MFLRLKQQKVLDETGTFCFALKNAVHGTPGGNRTHNGPLGAIRIKRYSVHYSLLKTFCPL